MSALEGQTVAEFLVQRQIGEGGMGVVYLGVHPLIGKRAAIKVLRPELMAEKSQVNRLLAEAKAVNAIRHHGIIDIFGLGELPDGRHYIVMDFLDGESLGERIDRVGALPLEEALELFDRMLAAVGAAHAAGVVHRDLKPGNVFLLPRQGGPPGVQVLDFGLAKRLPGPGTTAQQSLVHGVEGTPEYIAPEQAVGDAVSAASDIYSLGVTLFEMVTGRLPFEDEGAVALMHRHVRDVPPRAASLRPELSYALDALIARMLEKDPAARPASCEAIREALRPMREAPARPRERTFHLDAGSFSMPRSRAPERTSELEAGGSTQTAHDPSLHFAETVRREPVTRAVPPTQGRASGENARQAKELPEASSGWLWLIAFAVVLGAGAALAL